MVITLNGLFVSKEVTNLTYNLTDSNTKYMASFVSNVTGKSAEIVLNYFDELKQDTELVQHIREQD